MHLSQPASGVFTKNRAKQSREKREEISILVIPPLHPPLDDDDVGA